MSNEFQGKVTYHLLHTTNMGLQEFLEKFNPENIADMKVIATLPDGSVHTFQVCEVEDAVVTNFSIDGEEIIGEDIKSKEKITKTGSVIRLAI